MVTILSFSEVGGHTVNEDAFALDRHPADDACWLCCLADGQGGQAGGGRAAQIACRTAMEAAKAEERWRLAAASTWTTLLRHADVAVEADAEAGFTTLIGFCIAEDHLAGASCGDSAVLTVVPGERPREVTAQQHKNPPVGSSAAPFTPFAATLSGAWSVLAMSDGVWKYAGWEAIAKATTTERGQKLLDHLQRLVRLPGSVRFPDDFTVVLFEGE